MNGKTKAQSTGIPNKPSYSPSLLEELLSTHTSSYFPPSLHLKELREELSIVCMQFVGFFKTIGIQEQKEQEEQKRSFVQQLSTQ